MLLVGSRAALFHWPWWRDPVDTDLIGTFGEFIKMVEDNGYTEVAPLGPNKFVVRDQGKMIEVEIAWPGTSAEAMMKIVESSDSKMCQIGTTSVYIPSPDWLFTLKSSHKFKKNDPHFKKTMRDYHEMKRHGCEIVDKEWLKLRERETYTKKRPALNVGKKDFFSDDGLKYVYDHDTIHISVAHLDQPAYEYYKADGEEVFCSKKKWDECSEEIKLFGVLEEAYVLALERSQIPFEGKVSPRTSFDMALMKVCTSITSGWFRAYAYENYYKIWEMYTDDYVKRFQDGLKSGTVRELGS